MKRVDIVKEAKSWLGTKLQHQACLKNVACDCVGLIKGIYQELTGIKVEITTNYPAAWYLFKKEEWLYKEAKEHLIEIDIQQIRPGDILVFGFYKHPASHVGILTEQSTFIHSYQDIGQVIETSLDEPWQNRLRYAFSFYGVED